MVKPPKHPKNHVLVEYWRWYNPLASQVRKSQGSLEKSCGASGYGWKQGIELGEGVHSGRRGGSIIWGLLLWNFALIGKSWERWRWTREVTRWT